MALIQRGSLDMFSARIPAAGLLGRKAMDAMRTFSVIKEAARAIQPAMVEFDPSSGPRGLALKSLRLTLGFDGILEEVFGEDSQVYLLAWSWDLSGAKIVYYPGEIGSIQDCMIPLRSAQVRGVQGGGLLLFPVRPIIAGLATRIMIWESVRTRHDFGVAMSSVAHTFKTSKLNALLSMIASGASVTMAMVSLVKDAASELSEAVGKVVEANSHDYVDFYEGYYPVSDEWMAGEETHVGHASEIVLSRLV
jgi:hypothetical protein